MSQINAINLLVNHCKRILHGTLILLLVVLTLTLSCYIVTVLICSNVL